jgi:hypothetical protein
VYVLCVTLVGSDAGGGMGEGRYLNLYQ